jgi:predicted DsbA family dithiol-disulfide isomerase
MAAVTIDMISDVICPWCFLGKRRLDKALAQLPDIKAEVAYRPFFLDATIPAEGMDRQTYMLNKFGAERLKTIHDPLVAAGKEEGIDYAFNDIKRTPSSMNAHRLLRWSHLIGSQHTVKEALFTAYWCWGQDIGEGDVLKTIAIVNGFDGEDIVSQLNSDKHKTEVLEEARMAQNIGVSGVPTFIINRKYGVTGAQSSSTLMDVIRKAAAEPEA